MELGLVWLAFVPGRWRVACFFIVTVWQAVVIATANYAFLNYLVLVLAILLLDDTHLRRFVPSRWRPALHPPPLINATTTAADPQPIFKTVRTAVCAFILCWIFYAGTVPLVQMLWRAAPLPQAPLAALEPFRIANQYGLFAVMTPHRYEIEFQGSNDGTTWTAYPFRYKPQDVTKAPGIYAPYQPRFDWNLWFASLGPWQQYQFVPRTQELLLWNDRDVLALFAGNPFPQTPPRLVRTVLWQYWFSTPQQKRAQHIWWRRQLLGTYAPTLTRLPNGHFAITAEASLDGPPES